MIFPSAWRNQQVDLCWVVERDEMVRRWLSSTVLLKELSENRWCFHMHCCCPFRLNRPRHFAPWRVELQCGCLGTRSDDLLKKQRWKGTMKKSLGVKYVFISVESWICRKCGFCKLAFFNETARNEEETLKNALVRGVYLFQKTLDFKFNNCTCLCKTTSSLQPCLARRQVNSVNMPDVQVAKIWGFL